MTDTDPLVSGLGSDLVNGVRVNEHPNAVPVAPVPRGSSSPIQIMSSRKQGGGVRYEVVFGGGHRDWVAGSTVRNEYPALITAFEEEERQRKEDRGDGEDRDDEKKEETEQEKALRESVEELQQELHRYKTRMQEQQLDLEATNREKDRAIRDKERVDRENERLLRRVGAAEAGQGGHVKSVYEGDKPRPTDLQEYTSVPGGPDLDRWIQQKTKLMRLYHMAPDDILSYTVSRLDGPAYEWWEQLGAEKQAELRGEGKIEAALKARFQSITSEETAHAQLAALRQGSKHVTEYIADFQRLLARLGERTDTKMIMHQFTRGLSSNIASQLRALGVSTLQVAMDTAARVGNALVPVPTFHTSTPAPLYAKHIWSEQAEEQTYEDAVAHAAYLQSELNALHMQSPSFHPSSHPSFSHQHRGRGFRGSSNGRGSGRGGRSRGGSGGYGGRRPLPMMPGVDAQTVQQRMAEGACWRCGQPGHYANVCPRPDGYGAGSGTSMQHMHPSRRL